MITLHHLEYSQSFRILWLLEELGAPYELKLYERDPETRLKEERCPAASPARSPLPEGDSTKCRGTSVRHGS